MEYLPIDIINEITQFWTNEDIHNCILAYSYMNNTITNVNDIVILNLLNSELRVRCEIIKHFDNGDYSEIFKLFSINKGLSQIPNLLTKIFSIYTNSREFQENYPQKRNKHKYRNQYEKTEEREKEGEHEQRISSNLKYYFLFNNNKHYFHLFTPYSKFYSILILNLATNSNFLQKIDKYFLDIVSWNFYKDNVKITPKMNIKYDKEMTQLLVSRFAQMIKNVDAYITLHDLRENDITNYNEFINFTNYLKQLIVLILKNLID
jgi:hypothetical protein